MAQKIVITAEFSFESAKELIKYFADSGFSVSAKRIKGNGGWEIAALKCAAGCNSTISRREEVARFIERQLNWGTRAAKMPFGGDGYGAIELRELMDFIYKSPPVSDDEKIVTAGIGRNAKA